MVALSSLLEQTIRARLAGAPPSHPGAASVTSLAMMNTNLTQPRSAERRRHQRVKLRLSGQFMREDRQEFNCVTIDISPGGIALSSESPGEIDEKIVAYLNQIGRVQGVVSRRFYGGFAILMKLPLLKSEKMADQLTWLGDRQALGLPGERRLDRCGRFACRHTADGRADARSGRALLLRRNRGRILADVRRRRVRPRHSALNSSFVRIVQIGSKIFQRP